MLTITTIDELKDVLFRIRSNGKSIGFVPTMGALHEGHLSLIEKAWAENEVVVCSIFVNPVQFDNPTDLEKYPRTIEADIAMIEEKVDVVFMPSVQEIFPTPPEEKYTFGILETVMEGASRQNHFNGVAVIVKRLFDWINPDKAYFGEKDFQQLVIIKQLVKDFQLPVQIIACPIVREENGLAMSSRNRRLSDEEFQTAAQINRILQQSLTMKSKGVQHVKQFVANEINAIPEFQLDYFEIVNDETLQPVENFEQGKGIVGCIALYIGGVRLIDNVRYQ